MINIYISEQKTNILIFVEEEQFLIRPSENEKKFFEHFYRYIIENKDCESKLRDKCIEYHDIITKKGSLFGQVIPNFDENKIINNYFSFINQGINCLLQNNIISNSLSDYFFISGYILLYAYLCTKGANYSVFVTRFNNNIKEAYKRKISYIDLMRIAVSYSLFYINFMDQIKIQFTNELQRDNSYKAGFEFFKNIIQDLNEDSDLIFIYLQINSGSGLNLINQENCYKLSMISVEDVKSHIIENIPKYFYIYTFDDDIFFGTDATTQVICFNENYIFDKTSIRNAS